MRPRRHRWLTVSVFFITYSIFQAVFSASITPEPADETSARYEHTSLRSKTGGSTEELKGTTPARMSEVSDEMSSEGNKKNVKGLLDEEDVKKSQNDTAYAEDSEMTKLRKLENNLEMKSSIPTLRPPRETCTPPAIEQFPLPFIRQNVRKHGGLIIHIVVCVFTFVGLTIVCKYFVSSLVRICEEFKLAPDVAGATFMAAGSSAPQLATVVASVFCAQDDIGVYGVIGSSAFKLLFVISVCALCSGTVSHLNWWPLCRDCFFYAISILVMFYTISNGYVSWLEALLLLLMYGLYCVVLRFNTQLKSCAMTLLPIKLPTREEQCTRHLQRRSGVPEVPPAVSEDYAPNGQTKETPMEGDAAYNPGDSYVNAADNARPVPGWDSTSASPAAPGYYKAKEYGPETAIDPLLKPNGANALQLACWYVAFPVHWTCRHTMPDCRGRWYPVTFLISMLWISFYSYFMVWMITIIGHTLGIPDTVMGFTFVAAGVSVPDALSSLAVIKKGYGDMAVSNAVGSNVFDILVCLGLPWFIQTAIIQPGSYVNVISKGLIYSTLSLFSTVIFLVVATHANGWKLDRKYGVVLMIWYILFITLASLYELNVFGEFNHPDCVSIY